MEAKNVEAHIAGAGVANHLFVLLPLRMRPFFSEIFPNFRLECLDQVRDWKRHRQRGLRSSLSAAKLQLSGTADDLAKVHNGRPSESCVYGIPECGSAKRRLPHCWCKNEHIRDFAARCRNDVFAQSTTVVITHCSASRARCFARCQPLDSKRRPQRPSVLAVSAAISR